MKKFVVLLITAMAGGLLAVGIYKAFEDRKPMYAAQQNLPVQTASFSGLAVPPSDFVEAASMSVHAVVHIKAEFTRKNNLYDDFFESFFNGGYHGGRQAPITGTGSGVIISPDGYIVTNNHVVQDASDIEVTLNDKRVLKASVVGTEPSSDLAVIRIEANDLPFLNYGNSDQVQVGEWVLAVGNPFNLTSTVTAGIVSAKARNINILSDKNGQSIESFIQTDAAVNRGNSGGALVNTRGELIGINAAIASGTGFYTGYSFAIPVNIVKKVVRDLLQYGEIQRAFMGVQIREVDAALAADKNLGELKGVYVAALTDNSSAEKAGIKPGDVIIAIDGTAVNTNSELVEVVSQHSPGDKIKVDLTRDGKAFQAEVTLTNSSGNTKLVKREEPTFMDELGAGFAPVNEETKKELRIQNGVEVTELKNGALASIGIKKGFIITRIDRVRVNSTKEIEESLKGKRGGILIEGIYPNGIRAYYGLGL
jgi:Do/DeqQ family serine protease